MQPSTEVAEYRVLQEADLGCVGRHSVGALSSAHEQMGKLPEAGARLEESWYLSLSSRMEACRSSNSQCWTEPGPRCHCVAAQCASTELFST